MRSTMPRMIISQCHSTHKAPTQTAHQSPSHASRRALLGAIVGGNVILQCSSNLAALARDLTPFEEASRIPYGLSSQGSIRPCNGAVNPNCASTSSTNDMYAPAWSTRRVTTAANAANALEEAVLQVCPGARVQQRMSVGQGEGEFRQFTVPSAFGEDVMEFLIPGDSVSGRNWEGDANAGLTVLYRSQAGSVKYLWPLTLPITDGGAQKKRLDAIRRQLDWRLVGCELIECYGS